MNLKLKTAITIIGVIVAIFLMWYFRSITAYIIGAGVLSMIIDPLMEKLACVKVKKSGHCTMPRWLAAVLSLLAVVILFFGILFPIVSLVVKEAQVVSLINTNAITTYSENIFQSVQKTLTEYGWIDDAEKIEDHMITKLKNIFSIDNVSTAFSSIVSFISSFFMAVFSILFISFFFLKDKAAFRSLFLSIFPQKNQYKAQHVMSKTRSLLSRYFIGLLIQLSAIILLEFVGLLTVGIPNALLIAFIGGIMNIIPYIGPMIGAVLGIMLAVASALSQGIYEGIGWVIVKVAGVFIVANFIDNVVNQPLIFSKSVNAHPVEIFIVTLAAGSVAGIGGMIIAIPVYTVIRIILKEYLSEFSFINNITKNI